MPGCEGSRRAEEKEVSTMSSNKSRYLFGALAGAFVAGIAMTAGAGLNAAERTGSDPTATPAAAASPNFAPPPGAPMSFADIFEKVSPAVVSINVTSRVDMSRLQRQIPGLPFVMPPGQGGEEGKGGFHRAVGNAFWGFIVGRPAPT